MRPESITIRGTSISLTLDPEFSLAELDRVKTQLDNLAEHHLPFLSMQYTNEQLRPTLIQFAKKVNAFLLQHAQIEGSPLAEDRIPLINLPADAQEQKAEGINAPPAPPLRLPRKKFENTWQCKATALWMLALASLVSSGIARAKWDNPPDLFFEVVGSVVAAPVVGLFLYSILYCLWSSVKSCCSPPFAPREDGAEPLLNEEDKERIEGAADLEMQQPQPGGR